MQRMAGFNKKDRWDSRKPHLPTNNILCDIRIKIFATYRSSTTEYLNALDFDLSNSLKVKCNGAIRLPIYGFLFMFNSNIGHNYAPL